jgi:RNA polymerase sigma-70 factor (ECF subfamily)
MLRAGVTDVAAKSPETDEALVLRARNGDREAFGELVNRHQRRVWMVCRQYVGLDEADAVAQDSLIKAYRHIGRFDQRAAFSTWLTRIAINTCLDLLRQRGRLPMVVEEPEESAADPLTLVHDDQPGPEARSMQRQAVESLLELEAKLPERQREIFRLRYYAEMELEEIAAALDVHVGTVKTQLHRAVHRLRAELGAYR